MDQLIEKLPSEVFGFVATHDFENRPKRDPSVVEMTPTATGPIGEGATARARSQNERGRRVDGRMTATEYQPDRCFAAVSRFGCGIGIARLSEGNR